jgi:hypothetical protein
MRVQEARKQVLRMLGEECGYEIPEYKLSGATRRSIAEVAATFRHLLALKELVLLERENDARLASRLDRRLHGKKDTEIEKNLLVIVQMRNNLDGKIKELADRITAELSSPSVVAAGSPENLQDAHMVLKALKCSSCGANLPIPSGSVARCKYCGSSYTIEEYLDRLGSAMKG